jgi:prepilin-type processing-associated H-X9-DG protein
MMERQIARPRPAPSGDERAESGFTTTFTPNALLPYTNVGITYPSIDITSMRDGESTTAPTYAVVISRSYHSGMVNVLMMDGSSRSVANNVDLSIWRAAGTRSGRENKSLP